MNLQQIKQRYGIIGNSPRLNYALETATKVAPTELTVYIQGESGVGKESFSKIIHDQSTRKHKPFIAINSGAIPEGTINSELFGHEKGAFTGAVDTRKGYFETANGGTLFLDEIGELPMETQARLLRLLEYGEFIKVGSSQVQKTDVRIIAATNKDLLKEAENGKFREDLYYRLSTLPLFVPPLRQRKEDILLLFRKFTFDCQEKYRNQDFELSPEAEEILTNFAWPGNIRQLRNITEQICILEKSPYITQEVIQHYLPNSKTSLPALSNKNKREKESFSERDIFYKVLFGLKNDISDLKQIVLELLQNSQDKEAIIQKNESLLRRVLSDEEAGLEEEGLVIHKSQKETVSEAQFHHSHKEPPTAADEEEDKPIVIEAEHVVSENENLLIEDKEIELIKKALLKNNGRRKKAADDLGISERTLYRKINQYEIDI